MKSEEKTENNVNNYKERLINLRKKAYARLQFLRSRASADEQLISDGGLKKPRYQPVERAYARWKKLNDLAYPKKR